MSQISDEKMSPRLLNLYILFAFHCSLCSLYFLSLENFLDDCLMYLTLIFFSVRLFHLLACGKLIGGDWYLAPFLFLSLDFSVLISVCAPTDSAEEESPRLRDLTALWLEGMWVCSFLCQGSGEWCISAQLHQACREAGKMLHSAFRFSPE